MEGGAGERVIGAENKFNKCQKGVFGAPAANYRPQYGRKVIYREVQGVGRVGQSGPGLPPCAPSYCYGICWKLLANFPGALLPSITRFKGKTLVIFFKFDPTERFSAFGVGSLGVNRVSQSRTDG